MIFLVLGIGLVLLIAIGWAWIVFGGGGAADLPEALPRDDLFGTQLRVAWPGSDLLAVDAPDLDALTSGLVATLARHHRVIVAAPADLALAPCSGGPVFRSSADRSGGFDAQEIGDIYDALAAGPGPDVVVVVAGQGAAEALGPIRADLPRDVDLRVVLPASSAPSDAVRVVQRSGTWQVPVDGGVVSLRLSPAGFEATHG